MRITIFNRKRYEESVGQVLARLNRGDSLEQVLTDAGAEAPRLKSLLDTALSFRELRQEIEVPSPAESMNRFLKTAQQLSESLPSGAKERWWQQLLAAVAPMRPLAASLALATIILIAILAGGLQAAQASIPGDALYPLKQWGENAELVLPQSATSREALQEQFNRRRLDEIHEIIKIKRQESVVFIGFVQSLEGANLRISGLNASLLPETQIFGVLNVGAYVKAIGRTTPAGLLLLAQIQVLKQSPSTPPGPEPMPMETNTPTPPVPTITTVPSPPVPTIINVLTPTITTAEQTDFLATPAPTTAQATEEIQPTPVATSTQMGGNQWALPAPQDNNDQKKHNSDTKDVEDKERETVEPDKEKGDSKIIGGDVKNTELVSLLIAANCR